MRYLIMVLVVEALVSMAGATDGVTEDAGADLPQDSTSSSSLEIIEVFRADAPEELEATLSDGYPPAWLEEILTNESIPEEDRYWLDCRVRDAIAHNLHLFFNEEGDPVHFEADWIRSGEDYWRECFIVNPLGTNEQAADPPEGDFAGVSFLVDRFGNAIGEIAISHPFSGLSRNGAVGVTQSGIRGSNFGPGLMNLCFFYPDGNFVEFPMHGSMIHEVVSQSGALVVASCLDRSSSEEKVHRLYVFDGDADLLWQKALEFPPPSGLIYPSISADDRYIAVQTHQRGTADPVILFDAVTGVELHLWDLTIGNHLHFSPDNRFLCIAGGGAGVVVDCESGEVIWSRFLDDVELDPSVERVQDLYCTNDAEIIYWLASNAHNDYWTMRSQDSELLVIDSDYNGYPAISPNGYFYLTQRYLPYYLSSELAGSIRIVLLKDGE